jgi:anti-sigma factor RsiW
MTHCTGAPAEQFLEPYLDGTLPEEDALKFEEHYFDCPVCLAQVQALQAVALQLRNQPRRQLKAPIPWPIRFAALGAIAAMLLVCFIALRAKRETRQLAVAAGSAAPVAAPAPAQQASQSTSAKPPTMASAAVSQLADLTLPAFHASNLRGESRNPQFEAGMKAYANRDYAGAVKALAQVPAEDEDARAARFYSGVCQMHSGDLAGASQWLRSVANAGDSPQQEAAFYYLAQIAIEGNDVTAARRDLAHTVQLHGDFEARARAELIRIREAEGR